jgi:hypothetical protein
MNPPDQHPIEISMMSSSRTPAVLICSSSSRLQDAAKIRRRTPHDLRHSWASHMLAAGADLAYVSSQLGHSNPATTLRIYAHWAPGTRRVGTSILDRQISSTPAINPHSLWNILDFWSQTRLRKTKINFTCPVT